VDKVRNPFTPGAGTRPPLLVGRAGQLEAMTVAVQRLTLGRFERSLMLVGLRGVGKTVLLNEFGRIAEGEGWIHSHLEATSDVHLAQAIAGMSRRILLELSIGERTRDRARRALGRLASFITVHVPVGDVGSLTIDFEPVPGTTDTGQLDSDLGALFVEIGETARGAGIGVLLTLDEIQYLQQRELSALIVGLHRVSQLGLPVVVAGAGLPSLPGLAGEARSYAERLFSYVEVGALGRDDAVTALESPVEEEGATWGPAAIDLIIELTQGYPYFLQEFGKQAWNVADGPEISRGDAHNAIALARAELDQGFFRSRFDKTSDNERAYLRAMAECGGPGPYRSAQVAAGMGKTVSQVAMLRDRMIKRGLCFSPRRGEIAFTVPMFDDFVRRVLEP